MTTLLAACLALSGAQTTMTPIRPPAVPLIAHDPYFSIWSPSEKLAEADTQHWTGGADRILITATVDGKEFRLVGKEGGPEQAMEQTGLTILPTRVRAAYRHEGLELELTFLSASIATDLVRLSQPLTHLVWRFRSTDGRSRKIAVKVRASGVIAAANDGQEVQASSSLRGTARLLTVGTKDQRILAAKGDRIKIDWGNLILAAKESSLDTTRYSAGAASQGFVEMQFKSVPAGKEWSTLHAAIAYDDLYSVLYFGQRLRPYWRRNGMTGQRLAQEALDKLASVEAACDRFDRELMADFEQAGGPAFAQLAALSYRQCIAGCKLVQDPKGQPIWLPKENTSNGCVGTVDVIYPMSPMALLFGATLTRALLVPILMYSESGRWKFPFAPHDIGTYPHANGQVYGGGEKTEENQMPVEESANMLIMMAALAKAEGSADLAGKHWQLLGKWAEYLKQKGMNPENQLCTDDFLGHLAQNVNLSVKAILGLRSYAYLAERLSKKKEAAEYLAVAEDYAAKWVREASDPSHTRLTFDRPGTWSQKYNLVWDRLLGFGLFPAEVVEREVAWYRSQANQFGLPLDSRSAGAKLDWSVWTATLSGRREDFDALMAGVYRYVDQTPERVGLGDWYDTSNSGFLFMHSRPVVGGVLIPLLYNSEVWNKWAARDKTRRGEYAPIPPRPVVTQVVASSESAPVEWRKTESQPATGWERPGFDDSSWLAAPGGFGSPGTPGAVVRTDWRSRDIWIRREFTWTEGAGEPQLWLHHDDDVEVYLNGQLAFSGLGWANSYNAFPILPAARRALRPGKNLIAIHCRQRQGGQYIDAGLCRVTTGARMKP